MNSLFAELGVGIPTVGCEVQLPWGRIMNSLLRRAPATTSQLLHTRPGQSHPARTRLIRPTSTRAHQLAALFLHPKPDSPFEPEAIRVPSGENETELTESVCPRKGPLTRYFIPQLDSFIHKTRNNASPIRRE
ncbi:hypothetical protein CY34DRAFT_807749 [Suillus luteus UH-Slu-Lm8-n1]|uniref:Uncharacterized protein n=1 Tax=Suillus luteus UH-Slu-Lm8-n1 TaxID=930992 RepID=A0A0D0ADY9_9AGAM|nr:hypothetical protein CY34DRAFT_807749 [Suillus luteus UH-Slu-Lm8-n1]